ncbi:MAG TPA: methyltransferase domain-containing protein [Acidimicrobiales bacterium]|nr:methyltransferase domain-containing protein [Acidimicrobiales bacterium]
MEHDAGEVAAVFGRAAARYDTVIPFFARLGARLVEWADLAPGESVLDVGCGRGATLFPAAERVGPSGRVLGVDLSKEMVELLTLDIEQRGLANAEARQMNAEALEVADESFDVALSSFVLQLLPNPEAAAGELWRVLRRSGRVVASTPVGTGPQWDFLRRLFGTFGPRTTRPIPAPFRPDFDLRPVLDSAGFQVLRSVEDHVDFHFADEEQWWDWAWSQGMRAVLELLPPSDLAELREETFHELTALRTRDGIPLRQAARFVVAHKG